MYNICISYGFPMVFYLFRVFLKNISPSTRPPEPPEAGRASWREKTWNNKKTVARDIIIYYNCKFVTYYS
jgi:hypothetical protein